ncbi:hypothetical protein [Metamycoplasma hominis]|uniref:hypothetical protein n=1 Tax=Metamycoplasma hominis TaxID=2098 RepID=UPI001E314F32|nr:hypothetical protein [Metamycoplasma hominis]
MKNVCFWTIPKRFTKSVQNNSFRSSLDLNPYSCLVNEYVVKNKNSKISFTIQEMIKKTI